MGKLELKDSILFTNFVEIILTKDPLGEKSKTILTSAFIHPFLIKKGLRIQQNSTITSVTKIRSWLSRNCI